MQSQSSFLATANLHLHISSNSLLPFLYQTRTLQAKPFSRKARQPSSYVPRHHRSFYTTPRLQAPDGRPRRDQNIPFEGIPSLPDGSSPAASEPLSFLKPDRKSTITASEQAIFDRIFADLSQPSSNEDPADEIIDDGLDDQVEDGNDLQSIFDGAIKNLRLQEERYAETEERNRLKFASSPPVRAIGGISDKDSIWGRQGEIGEDYEDLSAAHRAHETKV